MAITRRYTKEELSRRGRELYRDRIESQLAAKLHGKLVAIDIDSGEYEVADKALEAADKLRVRLPDAQIWCERAGHPAAFKFGARLRVERS